MGKFVDLTGQKFRRLTVTGFERTRDLRGNSRIVWNCACDCGGFTKTHGTKLKSGHTQSCGCLQRERTSMASMNDISGMKFGRLTAIKNAGSKNQRRMWECLCDCGNKCIVCESALTSGNTKSCGCIAKELLISRNTVHGKCGTRLYKTWRNMKTRCYNKNCVEYSCYGGRGIKVCDEWLNDFSVFYDWAMEHGYDDNLTIDRIDNDKNYCPENCCWITRSENIRKRNVEYFARKRQEKYV